MHSLLRIAVAAAIGFLPLQASAQDTAAALTEQDARNIASNNGIVAILAIQLSTDERRYIVGGTGSSGEQMVLEIDAATGEVTRRQ
jgi:hypothetical protein